MRSLSNRQVERRARKAAEQEVLSQYNQIKYEMYKETVTETTQAAIAVMLYALSLNGYGKKRLADVFEWTRDILELPGVLGRTMTSNDIEEAILERYGIDVKAAKPQLMSWEQMMGGETT